MAKRTGSARPRRAAAAAPAARGPAAAAQEQGRYYCAMPVAAEPAMPAGLGGARLEAILVTSDKWVNGTVLHYFFFDSAGDGKEVVLADGRREWRSWVGAEAQRAVVRQGFKAWADLDIGIPFKETTSRDEAEIRIGFMPGDGSWSFLGTQILQKGPNERTMNFGWDLLQHGGLDTAIH
jgi:hypothetical protein